MKNRPESGPALNRFLFTDPAFVFQSLWRFGVIAAGGADLGEALTAVSRIRDGDRQHHPLYQQWRRDGWQGETLRRRWHRR